MKPQLADDWQESKLVFPLIGQPKVDGVRALNLAGRFTGRSLKGFKNKYATARYSHSALIGLDGEAAAGPETAADLCRATTSALGTIEGQPYILWWLFDYVTPATKLEGYDMRLAMLRIKLDELSREVPELWNHLRLMPSRLLHTKDELEAFDEENLLAGYEGTIIRDPNAVFKEGRSGKKPILWRIKRFVDFEFSVHEIIEGQENQNEATLNALGNTERSTHQENMVPNGMIGAMLGRTLNVVKDGDKVLFEAGQEVRVGAGCLSHDQRRHFFLNQDWFKNHVHKAKFFPKGIKDKLRFPTWQTFRDAADIS